MLGVLVVDTCNWKEGKEPMVCRNLKSVTAAPSWATIWPPETPSTDGRAVISLEMVGQALRRCSLCSFETWGMMTVR
jgi:hypothetical protein